MAAMLAFGILGYLMRKYGYEGAPMVLAFVLGPMFENSLRQSLLLSDGSFSIFFTRPIALGGMITTIIILISPVIPHVGKRRKAIPMEEET
jgi:putative tricarboxylic transport membrane protein